MAKSFAVIRVIVLRALVAASAAVKLLGAGELLASEALAAARAVVVTGDMCSGDMRAEMAASAQEMRQAFAAWAGPAALTEEGRKAADAVLAATSAAGCYARGSFEDGEAERLAGNALRFATEARGEEAGWIPPT